MACTAYFHIWWETTRISESHDNLTHETASQLQRFLGPNKGPGTFLRMRQEAVLSVTCDEKLLELTTHNERYASSRFITGSWLFPPSVVCAKKQYDQKQPCVTALRIAAAYTGQPLMFMCGVWGY
jgi:hypothetical protein